MPEQTAAPKTTAPTVDAPKTKVYKVRGADIFYTDADTGDVLRGNVGEVVSLLAKEAKHFSARDLLAPVIEE